MKKTLKTNLAKLLSTLHKFNIHFVKYDKFLNLESRAHWDTYFKLFAESDLKLSQILDLAKDSRSQLAQDLFALVNNNFKENGYFVEFGATNGIDLSNTYLLEKKFGWKGILAEPAKIWQHELNINRNCFISDLCVWKYSGQEVIFSEIQGDKELSTISQFVKKDNNKFLRKEKNEYIVKTISLEDLLVKYDAPSEIDFLSIDTEGSEFEILSHFNFGKYKFNVICVEHNFTETREKTFNLLTKNSYRRVLTEISAWDDWYVYESK